MRGKYSLHTQDLHLVNDMALTAVQVSYFAVGFVVYNLRV